MQGERIDSLLAICSRRHPVTGTFKIGSNGVANGFLVLDEQDATGFRTGVHDEAPFGFLPSTQCTIAHRLRQRW